MNEIEKNLERHKNIQLINSIIKPETPLEIDIILDLEFIEGAMHGKARNGHPEGQVIYHIAEVLANVDTYYGNDPNRAALRLISIIHDTFKYKVDRNKPKSGENHHGFIAAEFASKFGIIESVLKVIKMHDDAYNAWSKGNRHNDWERAEDKARKLVVELMRSPDILGLYLAFYRCDNETGDKTQECLGWFDEIVNEFSDGNGNIIIQ